MPHRDQLHRFLIEHTHVRGETVHIDTSWQEVLNRHDYPAIVREQLGKMIAAGLLLSATLKFNGSLVLQVQSDGPISLLVVQVSHDRTFRGTAEWQGEVKAGSLRELFGQGNLTLTIEPQDNGERYQSIVELSADSLEQALDNYFRQSEQLQTRLWFAADSECCAGLLLQALPIEADHLHDEDAWNRAVLLAETVENDELLELTTEQLLHRLYHEETVRLFDPEPLRFHCNCSRERITKTLRYLDQDELHDIIKEQGSVTADCSFCKKRYSFDPIDIESLLATATPPPESDSLH